MTDRVRYLCIAGAALLVFWVGAAKPMHNWDMVGYVASAYRADGYSGAALRDQTYAVIRGEVDAWTFAWLTHDSKYEDTVFRDPAALEAQLPFYSVRVVYVGLMRVLHATGVGYPQATYLISAGFAALSVIALAAVLAAGRIPFLAFPVTVVAAGYAQLAQLSSPDALCCCFSLWAMYCLIAKRSLLYLLTALLPLLRTDAILLSALLMAYAFQRGHRLLAGASFAAALAAYLLVGWAQHSYSLLTVFNFYFFQLAPFPAQMPISHRLADYLPPYYLNLRDLLIAPGPQTLIYLLCLYACIARRAQLRQFADRHAWLTLPMCFIALRLALFPNYEARFFVFPASMILAGTLGLLAAE